MEQRTPALMATLARCVASCMLAADVTGGSENGSNALSSCEKYDPREVTALADHNATNTNTQTNNTPPEKYSSPALGIRDLRHANLATAFSKMPLLLSHRHDRGFAAVATITATITT